MIIGSHVGLSAPLMYYGSVKEALSYNATALMVYTGAPQNTIRRPLSDMHIDEAIELIKEKNLKVIIHAPYIINMASPEEEKRRFAISFLSEELNRANAMMASCMVVHPGNFTSGTLEEGIANIIDCLNKIGPKPCKIALETMSGKGSEVGFNFSQIKKIMDGVNYPLYVCFDTCHTFDSGYDLINNYEDVLKEFDSIIGLDKILVFHINDSKNTRGSKKDRHENIGKGNIGFDVLHKIVHDERFVNVPKILETPFINGEAPYKDEIELLVK